MGHLTAGAPSCAIFRVISILAVTLAVMVHSGVFAQALTEPNLQKKYSAPPITERPLPTARAKPCSMYGAGFHYIPGTDTCVKLGGYLSVEGAAGSHR